MGEAKAGGGRSAGRVKMGYRPKPDDVEYRETPSWLRSFAVGFSLWWDDKGREHAEGVAIFLFVFSTIAGLLTSLYAGIVYRLAESRSPREALAVTCAYTACLLLTPLAINLVRSLAQAVRATAKAGRRHIEFKEIPPRSSGFEPKEIPPRSGGYEFKEARPRSRN